MCLAGQGHLLHAVDNLSGGLGVECTLHQAVHGPVENGQDVAGIWDLGHERPGPEPAPGVEVAEALAAQGRRAAAGPVGLDEVATRNHDYGMYPPPLPLPRSLGINNLGRIGRQIFEATGVRSQNLDSAGLIHCDI